MKYELVSKVSDQTRSIALAEDDNQVGYTQHEEEYTKAW